jgi:hypothetical protein
MKESQDFFAVERKPAEMESYEKQFVVVKQENEEKQAPSTPEKRITRSSLRNSPQGKEELLGLDVCLSSRKKRKSKEGSNLLSKSPLEMEGDSRSTTTSGSIFSEDCANGKEKNPEPKKEQNGAHPKKPEGTELFPDLESCLYISLPANKVQKSMVETNFCRVQLLAQKETPTNTTLLQILVVNTSVVPIVMNW